MLYNHTGLGLTILELGSSLTRSIDLVNGTPTILVWTSEYGRKYVLMLAVTGSQCVLYTYPPGGIYLGRGEPYR